MWAPFGYPAMPHWQSSSVYICLGTSQSTELTASVMHCCSSCREGCWKWGNIHHTVHKFMKTEIYKAATTASRIFTIFHQTCQNGFGLTIYNLSQEFITKVLKPNTVSL